jgi:Family of unknown function (DUF5906)/Primase C terminal 1 (PriCT-1)
MNNQLQSQAAFEDPIRNTTNFRASLRSGIDGHNINLALTKGRSDSMPESTSSTWLEVRELVSQPLEVADCTLKEYQASPINDRARLKDGVGIVPAKLKDPSLGRKSENIDTVSMIVLDIDCGMSMEEVKSIMQGTESVVHTTFSHTPEHPKLRVLIPLQKPVPPLHAKAILHQMQDRFGGRLDSACFDVAHMFYLPRCPKDAETLFEYLHVPGVLFNPETVIACKTQDEPVKASTSRITAANSSSFAKVEVGERNTKLTSQVGKWLSAGASAAEALEKAHRWNGELKEPLASKEVDQIVRSIIKTTERKAALIDLALSEVVAEMNKQYVFLTDTGQIFRLRDRKVVSLEQLRNTYANKTVIDDNTGSRRLTAIDAWLKSTERFQLRNITLAPGNDLVVDDCLNLWEGWPVPPTPGDVSPWRELVEHIFGKGTPEALYFEQWVAYPFQHPGAKLAVAVVIWSTQQGIGKSLLGESIAKLYGNHSTTITAQELHAPFNDWAKGRLFVIGEENSSSDRRADANRLKHLITGGTLYINQKNIPVFEQPNLMNLLFTSNHPDAFHLDGNDRRMFVHAANVTPLSADFYEKYGIWINSVEGQAALMDHMMHVDLTGFNPQGHAPHTAARAEMIEMSKSDVERFASEVFTDDFVDNVMHGEIISLDELTDRFNSTTKGSKSNPTAISRALRRCDAYARKRISTTNGRRMLISIRNHNKWATADNCEWTDEYEKGTSARIGGAMSL